MTFEHPVVLFLLALAALPLVAIPVRRRWEFPAASLVPAEALRCGPWRTAAAGLHGLALAALAAAAAGPVLPHRAETSRLPVRNILLLIDVSESMGTRDFPAPGGPIRRLDAARDVAARFLSGSAGDRVGIVAFGSRAFTLCPLTLDHQAPAGQIANLEPGVVGERTAIGDAIALGLGRLKPEGFKASALVLVTDGRNTGGTIGPRDAAGAAGFFGVPVHAIAVGSPEGAASEDGEPAQGPDLDTLRAISGRSGGRMFIAAGMDSLEGVFDEIARIRPAEEELVLAQRASAAPLLALAACLLAAGGLLVSATLGRTVPYGL